MEEKFFSRSQKTWPCLINCESSTNKKYIPVRCLYFNNCTLPDLSLLHFSREKEDVEIFIRNYRLEQFQAVFHAEKNEVCFKFVRLIVLFLTG